MSVMYAKNEHFTYDVTSKLKTKFLGNSVDVYPVGRDAMKLVYSGSTFHIIAREVVAIKERMTLKAFSLSFKMKKHSTKKTCTTPHKNKSNSFSQVPITPNSSSSQPSYAHASHHSMMCPPLPNPPHPGRSPQ
ncbi:hypothetical protein JHK87_052396 [Glycine soja]|nr:hypothetical protein JHK87_052396 [Glycine soja]